VRGDDVHVGADSQQARDPPLRYVSAADDDDPTSGQHQPGGVRRELVHVCIVATSATTPVT
jgi:hypothetical protein